MLTLSALYKYLIKSCMGYRLLGEMHIDERGPRDDRLFMVTDEHYFFRTQRREQGGFTKLARIRSVLYPPPFSRLVLSAPGMAELDLCLRDACFAEYRHVARVFDDQCTVIDQGEDVADWLSAYLGAPSRLVRLENSWYRRVDPVFSAEPAQTSLTDGFPILLISDASLEDLNRRLRAKGRPPVSRQNFRAALWVKGCKPYEEDTWRRIAINGIVFEVVKPCRRCSVTQVDWRTGEYREDNEPLITLREYRYQVISETGQSGVMFGQNLVHRGTGVVRVGDKITVLERKA